MFKLRKAPKQPLTAHAYLDQLAEDMRYEHKFVGYRLELTMSSGQKYVENLYFRGSANDRPFIYGLRLYAKSSYVLTNTIEISMDHIESVRVLNQLSTHWIGQKGWYTLCNSSYGHRGTAIQYVSEKNLHQLLNQDENESIDYTEKD